MLMQYRFIQIKTVFKNNITYKKFRPAIAFLSFSALLSLQNISAQLPNSSKLNPDTATKLISVIKDSSKIFSNLLSPSPNKSLEFSMNTDAKYFVDNFLKKNQAYYTNMKIWGKPYFDLYDRILTSYNLPVQLKYLSVIESSLNAAEISWAGAVGPWQIMSSTAHEHGLQTGYRDDRFDYIKSTNAACKILKELYSTYGDWLLVIAAYNAGSGSVNKAISKAHSKNFWDIQYYLPEETRNHVKKFIATNYFFEGDNHIDSITIARNAANDEYLKLAANSTTVNLYGKYNSIVIANTLMMDINIFNQLNPDFDKAISRGDIYPLRIPSDKVQLFQLKKMDMLKQSVEMLLSASNASAGK
jgi:membrane-bound lytic murein transglycosylase D